MDFDDTPEEAAFRREANDWLAAHAKPKRDEAELSGMSAISAEAELQHVRESKAWQHVLYDNGWAGITWPKEFGGRGGTSIQSMIFAQEMADRKSVV